MNVLKIRFNQHSILVLKASEQSVTEPSSEVTVTDPVPQKRVCLTQFHFLKFKLMYLFILEISNGC